MAPSCFPLVLILLFLMGVSCLENTQEVNVLKENDFHRRRESEESCQLLCLIDVIGFLYNDGEDDGDDESMESQGDELFSCRLQNDAYRSRAGYRIELPWDFSQTYKEELASGAQVCISEGVVDRASYRVIIAEDAELTLLPNRRRKLSTLTPITGRRSVLAVQLTTNFISDVGQAEEDPGMTKGEIEGSIFGTGPDAPGHDLVSQYRACSFGSLDLQPASGVNIDNGVAEVRLRTPVAGGEILGSLQDDILEATEERVGSLDQFDHIIYCIPDDALMDGAEKWTAFTYFHSHWSFFQKRRCSALSVTIHELGHNLGFRHSGYESESYGDESGYMGFTVYKTGAPIKCFNGHKNYLSGWFQDRALHVDPTMESSLLIRLVTFVDYDKEMHPSDVVLIRVGSYYIQYNRAKGINIDTGMNADKVSITYAQDHLSDSEAIAGLTAGQKTELPNFRNTGFNLAIEVCEFGSTGGNSGSSSVVTMARQVIFGDAAEDSSSSIDFAWVSIYLEDGVQQSRCNRAAGQMDTAEPSGAPTSLPPSLRPTSSPTQKPSANSAHPTSLTPTSNSPTRSPTDIDNPVVDGVSVGTAGLQQERLQKRRQKPAIKDMNKLVKDESDKLDRRRRLKGGH